MFRKDFIISLKAQKLKLGQRTAIMGIVNCTPDSFSLDGCYRKGRSPRNAVAYAQQLIADGADILDIGGESTRPGSRPVSEHEEIARILPVIKALAKQNPVPISVDTYKCSVAKYALDNGATIVNNIFGSNPDKELLKMVKNYGAAIVLMHMRGTPQTMQKKTRYQNLIDDIIQDLRKSMEKCLDIGMKSDKIILDPGIGFAKTAEQNLTILNRLAEFQVLKRPILVGTSRKSFIGKIVQKDANNRLAGTIASVCVSVMNGAHIIRVHDVKPAKDAVRTIDAILRERIAA